MLNDKTFKQSNTATLNNLKNIISSQKKWIIIESSYSVSKLYKKLNKEITKTLWISDNSKLIPFIANSIKNNPNYNDYYNMLKVDSNVYIFMQHLSYINELITKYRWNLIIIDINTFDKNITKNSELFLLLKKLRNINQKLILITSSKIALSIRRYFNQSFSSLIKPTINTYSNFRVLTEKKTSHKLLKILTLLQNIKGKGIIFISHKEEGQLVKAFLDSKGYSSVYTKDSKVSYRYLKNQFSSSKSHLYAVKVVITNSIDDISFISSDINWIIHYNFSSGITDYLKELNWITSKTNEPESYIFYNHRDKVLRESIIKEGCPDNKSIRMVYSHIKKNFRWGNYCFVPLNKHFSNLRLSNKRLKATLKVLEQKKLIKKESRIISYAKILIDSYTFKNYPQYLNRMVNTDKQNCRIINVFTICKNTNISPIAITKNLLNLEQEGKILFLEKHFAEAYYITENNDIRLKLDYKEIRKAVEIHNDYNELNKLEQLVQKKLCLSPDKPNITDNIDSSTMTGRVILGILVVLEESFFPLGKCLVSEVLTGSGSKKLKKLKLDTLSLYSSFSLVKAEYIKELVIELILNGLLEEIFIKGGLLKGLRLSNKGVEVVKKEGQFNKFFWKNHKQNFSNKKSSLYSTIKKTIDNEYKGKLSDNILKAISYMRPENKKELSMIKGIKHEQVDKLAPLVLQNTLSNNKTNDDIQSMKCITEIENFIKNEFYPQIKGDFNKGYSLSYYTSISEGKRSYTPIGKIVHNYKYKNKKEISHLIKDKILSFFEKEKEFLKVDFISVIPSHKKYPSITSELAEWISIKLNIPFQPDLIMQTRDSNYQKTLDTLDKRVNNSLNLFTTAYKDLIKNRSILIMDDIYDSGTTANECTRYLKAHKAYRIYLLTCTKTSYRDI